MSQFAGAADLAGPCEEREIFFAGDCKNGGAAGRSGIKAVRQGGSEPAGRQVPLDAIEGHHAARYQQRYFQKQQPAAAEQAQKEQSNGEAGNTGADEGQPGAAFGQHGAIVGEQRAASGQISTDPGQWGTPGRGGKAGVDVLVVLDDADQVIGQGNQEVDFPYSEDPFNLLGQIRAGMAGDDDGPVAFDRVGEPEIELQPVQVEFIENRQRLVDFFLIFDPIAAVAFG